jgi:hypothetical protein
VSYIGNRVPNNPENNNINQISPQWNAQCDAERGGNPDICNNSTIGKVTNPYQGKSDFAGGDYYSPDTLSGSYLTRPYRQFEDITENGATNDGKNWYNAFEAVGSHQLSGSLSLHATYTHAKALSTGGWVPGNNTWTPNNNPSTGWVDQLNHVFAREVSTYADVKHSVTLSGVAILPFGRNRRLFSNANRFADEIVNGWEVTPIYTYYSGFAWRPTNSGGNNSSIFNHSGNWEMKFHRRAYQ